MKIENKEIIIDELNEFIYSVNSKLQTPGEDNISTLMEKKRLTGNVSFLILANIIPAEYEEELHNIINLATTGIYGNREVIDEMTIMLNSIRHLANSEYGMLHLDVQRAIRNLYKIEMIDFNEMTTLLKIADKNLEENNGEELNRMNNELSALYLGEARL